MNDVKVTLKGAAFRHALVGDSEPGKLVRALARQQASELGTSPRVDGTMYGGMGFLSIGDGDKKIEVIFRHEPRPYEVLDALNLVAAMFAAREFTGKRYYVFPTSGKLETRGS